MGSKLRWRDSEFPSRPIPVGASLAYLAKSAIPTNSTVDQCDDDETRKFCPHNGQEFEWIAHKYRLCLLDPSSGLFRVEIHLHKELESLSSDCQDGNKGCL